MSQPFEGSHEGPRSRGELHRRPDLVQDLHRQPLEHRDALAEALGEVEGSPRIAASVTAATSTSRPAWAASSSITSSWIQGRVDVHDDEASAAASPGRRRRPRCRPRARGTPARARAARQHVGAGDVELHGRDGVAREAADPVDVGAVGGDPGRHRGHRTGQERGPEEHHGDPAGAAWGVVTGSRLEADVEVEGPGDGGDGLLQAVVVASEGANSRASVRWPRTTTCSTSRTSEPTSAMASKSALLTPGRSSPLTVTRVVAAAVQGSSTAQRYRAVQAAPRESRHATRSRRGPMSYRGPSRPTVNSRVPAAYSLSAAAG